MRRLFPILICLAVAGPAFAQDAGGPVVVEDVTVDAGSAGEEGDALVVDEIVVTEGPVEVETGTTAGDEAPSTPEEVIAAGQKVVETYRTGEFALIAGAAIFFLLLLLRLRLPLVGSVTSFIPKRARVLIVLFLAALAGVFDAVALGTPWVQAVWSALFTAPTAVFANELFVETLLGRRYKNGTSG